MTVATASDRKLYKQPTWQDVESRISDELEERIKERGSSNLVTNVEVWTSSDLLPESAPETSGSLESHLSYLVAKLLTELDVIIYDEIEVRIVPAVGGLRNEFAVRLVWNEPIPVGRLTVIRQDLRTLREQLKTATEHVDAVLNKLPDPERS